MPWQRHVLDVALEIDPETGIFAYQEVRLTVPRQSGKTVLLLALMVHRALGFKYRPTGEAQRIRYAAQTQLDAVKKWQDEHCKILEKSHLKSLFKIRSNNGFWAILWNNGSIHGISANTEKSGHGETLDLGVLDEAFAHVDSRMEQAMKPAMVTRNESQLWVVSTAGTAKSTYLRSKVDSGRSLVEMGLTTGVAYFEWSAPDDAEPGDPETWRGCMPALGYTVTEAKIRSLFHSMDRNDFRRAFLNQWPDSMPVDSVIDMKLWGKLADRQSQRYGDVAFGVDMNPERTSATIAVYGLREDGLGHLALIRQFSDVAELVTELARLKDFHNPLAIGFDVRDPAGSLLLDLAKVGITPPKDQGKPKRGELAIPTATEKGRACVQFYDAVKASSFRHLDHRELNLALAGAKTRDINGLWGWDRKSSTVDISPLNAATLARWAFESRSHLITERDSRMDFAFIDL